jgi:branched-chain amino acid transport system substrate-binding protein
MFQPITDPSAASAGRLRWRLTAVLSPLAAWLLAAALAGCPSPPDRNGGDSEPGPVPVGTTTAPPDIKIGAILPQTGAGALVAEHMKYGMDLAAEELNSEGKVKVSIIYEDSKSEPKEGLAAYNKLIATDHPTAMVIGLSSVASALAPLAEDSNLVQLLVCVAKPGLADGKLRFRVYPTADGMAGEMAKYNIETLGLKNAAIVYLNDDFGQASMEAYESRVKAAGGSVVFKDSYEAIQKDFRATLSKLAAQKPKPEVVFLCGYGPAYSIFITQYREAGIDIPLTSDMSTGLPSTLAQAGDAANGIYFAEGPIAPEFADKFKKRFGKDVFCYSGYGYDAVMLLARAAQAGGTSTPDLARELLEVQGYDGAMGQVGFDASGETNLKFAIRKVEGGKVVDVTKSAQGAQNGK